LQIERGEYLPYEVICPKTNHQALWIDITYVEAFGHHMSHITRPSASRLQCSDPRSMDNFVNRYKKMIEQGDLLQKAKLLEQEGKYPLEPSLQEMYEMLDTLWYEAVEQVERKCRKLRMGQVAFSPNIQLYMQQITAWSLLEKRAKGKKVSSRYLARSLKKAELPTLSRGMGFNDIQDNLKEAY
jgi:hypothetical protein